MFLRRQRKTVDSIHYDYWTLCESVRTEKGPRQRIVANLGKLTPVEAKHRQASWQSFEALLEGGESPRQMELGDEDIEREERIPIEGVRQRSLC